jgi:hypothetical protein
MTETIDLIAMSALSEARTVPESDIESNDGDNRYDSDDGAIGGKNGAKLECNSKGESSDC